MIVCQEGCFDHDPTIIAATTAVMWLKCSACGKLNIRRKQEARGGVVRAGGNYNESQLVVECAGAIDQPHTPSFWAYGAYVMVGLTGLKLTDSDRIILARCKRNADVIGSCSCGEPAAPSRAWKNETTRCDLCGGPACDAKTEICCECFDGAAT